MSKLLIVSDIHGNWTALEAVLEAEPDFDAVAFCGDVVDYGPQPVRCLRWLRENARFCVRGNHDNALAFDQDCRCMGSFRAMSLATRAWHRTLLSPDDLRFLQELPTLEWFAYDGRHFRMAHATPQGDMFEYLAPEDWKARTIDIDAEFVLLGHTHDQNIRPCGITTVVNPGSVGLARDIPGLACYAVYEDGLLTTRRAIYDVARTVEELRSSPLPVEIVDFLAHALGATMPNAESDSAA